MTTDATRRSHAFNRKRSTQQLVLRLSAWYIIFCGPQAQETKYWDLKHFKSVAAQAGHPGVHLYFCLQEKVACILPPAKSLGNFTPWSKGRVP